MEIKDGLLISGNFDDTNRKIVVEDHLTRVKEAIRNDEVILVMSNKNKTFMSIHNMKDRAIFELLKGIDYSNFRQFLLNTHPDYPPTQVLYVFETTYEFEVESEYYDHSISIYTKTSELGKQCVVVSFHEAERPM